jgi:mercuric reductase
MLDQKHFDLVILGSGSTAFAAALRAQDLGKSSVMTEERQTGGTCVNRDCLPSKNLIEAAKIVYDASHPRYPGLSPAKISVSFQDLSAQKDDLIRGYRKKKYESLVGGLIKIEYGHAEFVDDHTVEIDGNYLSGEKVLIATGAPGTSAN